jgi:hypothetical protein
MSDLLTHWAIHDDCRRIVLADPRFEPDFASVLTTHNPTARLGAITRYGGKWVPRLLGSHRPDPGQTFDTAGRPGQRLAFALGGITHFSADYVMKPVMSRLAKADWNRTHHAMAAGTAGSSAVSIREISAYYDCHVFREVYLAGHEEPFNRFLLLDHTAEPVRAVDQLIRSLFQRAILASHTFKPEPADADGWLDALLDHTQPLYLQIELYSRVYAAPDPAKLAAYEVESTFYRRDDRVLRLARSIQRREPTTPDAIDAATTPDANSSAYATAVALGVRTLGEAADYWRRRRPEPPDVSQG